jgi:hypothetical protein
MATSDQVRQYLAYWFQLGKKVVIQNTDERVLPEPVIQGDRYSDAFEACWQQITAPDVGDCYLDGTSQTIQELLTPVWEVSPCVRCDMPVPVFSLGLPTLSCPCIDLPLWPNTEIPSPRSPVNDVSQMVQIRDRLMKMNEKAPPSKEQLRARAEQLKANE